MCINISLTTCNGFFPSVSRQVARKIGSCNTELRIKDPGFYLLGGGGGS